MKLIPFVLALGVTTPAVASDPTTPWNLRSPGSRIGIEFIVIGLGPASLYPFGPEPQDPGTISDDPHARWNEGIENASDWLSPGGIPDGVGAFSLLASLGGSYVIGMHYARAGGWDEPGVAGLAPMLVSLEAAGATLGASEGLKALFDRPRPYTSSAFRDAYGAEFQDALVADKEDDAFAAMPSGHTSLAAYAWTAPGFTWLFHELDGDGAIGGPLVALAGGIGVAAMVGELRVQAGMHHRDETLVGLAIGTGLTGLISWGHFATRDLGLGRGAVTVRLQANGAALQARW
jgi:membrane-associated phospholipid phosphatase